MDLASEPISSSTGPSPSLPMPKTVPAKEYDWTYTTTYTGHEVADAKPWSLADPENPSHTIQMAELTRPDPILFYAEIPLFEDELHDNGSSNLLVRIVSGAQISATEIQIAHATLCHSVSCPHVYSS